MSHFLVPFCATADHAISRAHDRVMAQNLPPYIMREDLVPEIRAALSTLLPEQHETVWAAVRLVRKTRERGAATYWCAETQRVRRFGYARAIALVEAPTQRTLGRAVILRGERD